MSKELNKIPIIHMCMRKLPNKPRRALCGGILGKSYFTPDSYSVTCKKCIKKLTKELNNE